MSRHALAALAAVAFAGLAGPVGCASAPKLPVFGTWTIAKVAAQPVADAAAAPVPALAYIGLSASFAANDARFGGDRCGSPTYTPGTMTGAEIQQQYHVTPSALGLSADPVTIYKLTCGAEWSAQADTLIVKPDGALLAPVNGRLFEMVKR